MSDVVMVYPLHATAKAPTMVIERQMRFALILSHSEHYASSP
jgi:hypothetical protein